MKLIENLEFFFGLFFMKVITYCYIVKLTYESFINNQDGH